MNVFNLILIIFLFNFPISWILKVICPCDLRCTEHDTLNCQLEDCLHFLPLDECLNKKVGQEGYLIDLNLFKRELNFNHFN